MKPKFVIHRNGLQRWATASVDLLYPRHCVLTHKPLHTDSLPYRYLSRDGLRQLKRIEQPHCKRCGTPFWGAMLPQSSCPNCKEHEPVFHRGQSLYYLNAPMRTLLHQYKYAGARWLLPDLQELFSHATECHAFFEEATLVPVPLHPRKQRKRGYNQSECLANAFVETLRSKHINAEVRAVLCRNRFTPSQTQMDRRQRQQNMKDAFETMAEHTVHSSRRYLIIDDLFTTGATLNACARALKRAGAEKIDIFTFAHG